MGWHVGEADGGGGAGLTSSLFTALVVAGSAVLGFLGVCLGYVVISFALLWRAVPPPPFASRVRIMSREFLLAALVQPLLPFFYLVGRKMASGAGQPVVLVHGYFQNRADFLAIVWKFRRAGLGPLYGFNYPWMDTTARNVERLASFIAAVRAETGKPSVDLIAHSMGGLVCLEYIADEAHKERVRRCVTIATPHAGVQWGGPILGAASREIRATSVFLLERRARVVGVPCLSIYSPTDNVVFPAETSALALRGGTDKEAPAAGHFSILFEPEVIAEAAAFLAKPDIALTVEGALGAANVSFEVGDEGGCAPNSTVQGAPEGRGRAGEDETLASACERGVDELSGDDA